MHKFDIKKIRKGDTTEMEAASFLGITGATEDTETDIFEDL